MPTYEKLRARINELLPDRLELKFGCEVMRYAGEAVDTVCSITSAIDGEHAVRLIRFSDFGAHYDFLASTEEIEHWKILGTPIYLHDVLRALDKSWDKGNYNAGGIGVAVNGMFFKDKTALQKFDLSKPLSDQSKETLTFFAELLDVK